MTEPVCWAGAATTADRQSARKIARKVVAEGFDAIRLISTKFKVDKKLQYIADYNSRVFVSMKTFGYNLSCANLILIGKYPTSDEKKKQFVNNLWVIHFFYS